MKSIIVFIPFAYGGNPASESGPRCIRKLMDLKSNIFDYLVIEQEIKESPWDFLTRIQIKIEELLLLYEKIVIVGGNHLSILPIYQVFYSINFNSIFTLDAHRDFYPDNDINHATFMKELKYNKYVNHYLIGVRDYKMHNNTHENIKLISLDEFYKINDRVSLTDIDIDVIDPFFFPWCGSAIENGLSIDEVFRVIEKNKKNGCNVLSFSEYIPNCDEGLQGAKRIINYIIFFLEN